MLGVINKYLKPKHPEQANWFVKKTINVIYDELKTKPDFIDTICAYYNHESQSSILKLKFDKKIITDQGNPFLYMLLDYQSSEMKYYGRNFEQHISDNTGSITWIQNNKILVFYPDNETMALLAHQLTKENA
jgi:hypothetical protein